MSRRDDNASHFSVTRGLIVVERQSGRALDCRARGRASRSTRFFDCLHSPIAIDVHFVDRGVVHEPINGSERHGLIWEDFSYARLLARHLERYLPGHPHVLVRRDDMLRDPSRRREILARQI